MKNTSTTTPPPRTEPFAKFRELSKGIRIAMLTTVAPNGTLHSRPMSPQEVGPEGDLWFFTGDDTLKVDEIARNPRVNVSYASADGETFFSVSGRASLSYDRAKIHELWSPILKAWFPEGPNDTRIALLRVKIEAIDFWEGPGKVISLFKMAAAIVTGEQANAGEYGHINPPNR
ncbi:pyridoxamine 5'-phosphate oxidase family protein [Oleiharenicola lentus]|uniref:pyridoxamine 5'-phosphate oxidase family protein n=1 Tax=Oleiharenicola lentus TaxID=2508720 RepID=UPI003F667C9D